MKIYDISVPLSESLVSWPGDPNIVLNRVADVAKGDVATVTQMSMGLHSGTHIDCPSHFIADGKTSDSLDLNRLIGPCFVISIHEGISDISATVLDSLELPENTERLLFHTKNSQHWRNEQHEFVRDYVAITESGAQWLVDKGIGLVGVDYLSVASFDDPVPTHQVLLAQDIIIIEGLNLQNIPTGFYQLICLPMSIPGVEALPARVVLTE